MDAVTEGTRVLTAVGVITVNATIAWSTQIPNECQKSRNTTQGKQNDAKRVHTLTVVVFAIEAFTASLLTTFVLAAPASDLATIRRVIQAIRILAVLLAVTVVVATILLATVSITSRPR